MHLKEELESYVAEQFKILIESKHLYQLMRIEAKHLLDEVLTRVQTGHHHVSSDFARLVYGEWSANDSALDHLSLRQDSFTNIVFSMPDVKLFCSCCKRVEAFNSVSTEEFLRRAGHSGPKLNQETVQVFVAAFLCQSCKSVPEVFVVRRVGSKLTICGRAPIETVDTPNSIPKVLRQYYSNSVVAHQSGQTLAGNFLLRTLIEQWAKRVVAGTDSRQVDEVLDLYMETLPQDFKSRFPSLRALYGDLSSDIHSARGDPELFERARIVITEHFEARRLFKLPESGLISTNPPQAVVEA